jgi:hypothetical protein
MYLEPGNRIKGALATLIGSISQITVTLIMGMAGGFFYFYHTMKVEIFWLVVPELMVLLSALLIFFYFNLRQIKRLVPRKKWLKPLKKYLLVYRSYDSDDFRTVLLISFGRYLVYSVQFFLLMALFGAGISFFVSMPLIFLTFLVQMAVPSNNFTELAVRGASAFFFFQHFTPHTAEVVAASYSLWLINIILPGFLGIFTLLLKKLYQGR